MPQSAIKNPHTDADEVKNPVGRPEGSSNEGSRPDQIAKLEVGESYSMCMRVPENEVITGTLSKKAVTLSNTLRAAVRRATAKTGHHYVVEVGNVLTQKRHYLVVAAATRVATEAECLAVNYDS